MRCDCKRNDCVLKLCSCHEQQQNEAQASKLTHIQTISPAESRMFFPIAVHFNVWLLHENCSELWKVIVQGESAKRRPESIQHFLFLVSVFLFGERDLYCRARYFTREKRCPSQVYKTKKKNTFRKIRPFLISELSRGKVLWKSCWRRRAFMHISTTLSIVMLMWY